MFERELAGRPGGTLLAGGRVIAASRGRGPGATVRTTIDSGLQQAAVTALAGRLGGIAALDARTAEVRALAGHRVLGPPAARLDLQDRHHHGRARGSAW